MENELNMNEMEEVSGGARKKVAAGGMKNPPDELAGCIIYKIAPGETLGQIAKDHRTTVAKIKAVNPSIKDVNLIRAGYYIYIPV